jgi:PTH1 family peptidyl-tRNA hydrolase
MKLIAGLGNPGPKYRHTRHNLGFLVLERLAEALHTDFDKEKHQGLLAETSFQGEKLLLVKPMTFMNRSGDCVAAVARNRIFSPADVLIVVDDVNLPLSKMRLRSGGSAGGHNGLKSLIERLGTQDFHRLRMGVGDDRAGRDLADHVLAKFRPEEWPEVEAMVARAAEAALHWVAHPVQETMDRYN